MNGHHLRLAAALINAGSPGGGGAHTRPAGSEPPSLERYRFGLDAIARSLGRKTLEVAEVSPIVGREPDERR
jgi:hypothetical protein